MWIRTVMIPASRKAEVRNAQGQRREGEGGRAEEPPGFLPSRSYSHDKKALHLTGRQHWEEEVRSLGLGRGDELASVRAEREWP